MLVILALDQGTTSSRALVFGRRGEVLAVAQREFTQHFPRPGWVEHDPEEIWSTQAGVAVEALSRAGVRSRDVAAVGITNQRETTIVWERATGRPIHNAIVWQDRRTAGHCDRLVADGYADLFRRKTGLVIDPYFSGSKLGWLLDHVDGARKQAEAGGLAFGTVDSWLVWKLTGGRRHVTDVTNASRTLLFNIHTGRWDDELLDVLGIPHSVLPEVRSSSEVYDATAGDILAARVPIASLAGDQQAALFGQACLRPGMGKNTYGTGAFMLMNTGVRPVDSRHRLLTTVAWRRGDEAAQYALEGSVFVAGAVVQWLRDGLGLIRTAAEIEGLARQAPDTADVYFVPAFVGLGAPYWDPYARGTITGISRGTTAAHMARAALESIAFQSAEVVRAQEADAGIALQELRVDGGAAANDLLLQVQADLLGVPVVRPAVTETTALGAAYLAGLAVGFWNDEEEVASLWQEDRRFEPSISRDEATSRMGRWQEAVRRARGWVEP